MSETRLIRRKRQPLWIITQFHCPKCNYPLIPSQQEGYQDFVYCSKCNDWYYLKKKHERQSPYKIEREKSFGRVTAGKLRKKMEQYVQQFQERQKETIKTWTKDQYDQEFLLNLIPKK